MIINLELKDKWLSYAGGKPCFLLVGDNEDYSIHFDTDLNKAAVFAVFKKEGKEQRYLLDESGNVNIPLWVLKNGTFRVGLISDGFASTPLAIYVVESILDKDCAEAEEVTPTQVEQLTALVNKMIAGQHGINIERVFIEDGELIIELSNGNKITAGTVKGDTGSVGATPKFSIGNVNTVESTEPASATITGTPENPVLNLNIPRGRIDTQFDLDETLTLKNGTLSVNTTNDIEEDNSLPITSSAVYTTVGNIEILLKTI